MTMLIRFPEPAPCERRDVPLVCREDNVVPIKGVNLSLTLETVAFLRTLENQSYLDRFNRSHPLENDLSLERHKARFSEDCA